MTYAWGPPPLQPPMPPQPSKNRRGLVAVVIVAVLVVLVLVGILAAHLLKNVGEAIGASACGAERPPAGASRAAVAYVDAVNAATPARVELDKTITSANGMTHHDDLLTEIQIDDAFLADVRAIKFPDRAAGAAAAFIAAVEDYDAFLLAGYNKNGYISAHRDDDQRLNSERARAGEQLRNALRLPQSQCVLSRP